MVEQKNKGKQLSLDRLLKRGKIQSNELMLAFKECEQAYYREPQTKLLQVNLVS